MLVIGNGERVEVLDIERNLAALSAAGYRGDGPEIVRLLQGRDPGLLLQQAGEALIVALAMGLDTAAGLAGELVGRLTDRGWEGDDELAAQLSELSGGARSGRRAVPADLDELADLLEGPLEMGFGGLLDLETGSCWPESVVDDWGGDEEGAPDPEGEPDRWVFVPNVGSGESWRDMERFAETVGGPVGDRLAEAIDGRGAFSRFRRELDRHPDLIPRWLAYRSERRAGRARSWLAAEGYDPLPPKR